MKSLIGIPLYKLIVFTWLELALPLRKILYSSVPREPFDIYFGSCVWCYLLLDSSSAFDIFFTKQYHVNESFPVYLFIFVCRYIFSIEKGLVQFINLFIETKSLQTGTTFAGFGYKNHHYKKNSMQSITQVGLFYLVVTLDKLYKCNSFLVSGIIWLLLVFMPAN